MTHSSSLVQVRVYVTGHNTWIELTVSEACIDIYIYCEPIKATIFRV